MKNVLEDYDGQAPVVHSENLNNAHWKDPYHRNVRKRQFKTNCPPKECLKCKRGWVMGQGTCGQSHEQMTYNSDGVPTGEDSVLQTAGKELPRPLQAPP